MDSRLRGNDGDGWFSGVLPLQGGARAERGTEVARWREGDTPPSALRAATSPYRGGCGFVGGGLWSVGAWCLSDAGLGRGSLARASQSGMPARGGMRCFGVSGAAGRASGCVRPGPARRVGKAMAAVPGKEPPAWRRGSRFRGGVSGAEGDCMVPLTGTD